MDIVKDPFNVTPEQQEKASDLFHEIHLRSLEHELTADEKAQQLMVRHIASVGDAESWMSRCTLTEVEIRHWNRVSSLAIDSLKKLGFKTNEDIRHYLETGEYPEVAPIDKVKAVFPSLEWSEQKLTPGIDAIFTKLDGENTGCPIEIEILLSSDDVRVFVSLGKFPRLQLFSTPSQQGITLDEALAQLKLWFEQMAEVFAGVTQ
jgi:hypothetical protein